MGRFLGRFMDIYWLGINAFFIYVYFRGRRLFRFFLEGTFRVWGLGVL